MNLKKLQILFILCNFVAVSSCSSQKVLVKSNDEYSKLEQSIKDLQKEKKALSEELVVIKSQLSTSLSIYKTSNSDISNKLSTMSITIALSALILAIFGLILGTYINKKEKSVSQAIDKGKGYLDSQIKLQDEINKKLDQTQKQTSELSDLVKNNLGQLYIKLKNEELNEIISDINKDPSKIRIHISRLVSLQIKESYYDEFATKLYHWHSELNDRESTFDLFIFMLIRFPDKIAGNQFFSQVIYAYWSRASSNIPLETVKTILKGYYLSYKDSAYTGVEKDLETIFSGLKYNHNDNFVINEILLKEFPEKSDQFEIYNFLTEHNPSTLRLIYAGELLGMYNSKENTTEEEETLDKIRKLFQKK